MERDSEDGAARESPPPSVPLSGQVLLPHAAGSGATRSDVGVGASPGERVDGGAPAWGGKIGRYVVLRAIGSGGMGVVLAAYDPDLDRKVALKILHDGVHSGSAGALRMRREAQAMARLSHPNVAQVYEVAEDRGRLFLAMEYIAGTTLREWLNAAPRPWRETLRVHVEAGRGLAAAHAAGLMHRDFKPDNAMLGADGRVRVLDFGLSRLHATGEEPVSESPGGALQLQVTVAGTLIGTPAYMSPEQFDRKEADARSDQFSFCVATWEALYGQRPFAGRTVAELTIHVRRGVVLAPPEESEVPTRIRRVLERGLAVDPALRWPSIDALLAALTRDPARVWWRWGAVAGVLAIAGASYGVATYRAAEAQVCARAADELSGAWGNEQRAAVEQALRSTGAQYADRAAVATVEHLDAYAERWVAVHTAACTSHQRGHTSPLLLDRQMACLRQRRTELAATAVVLEQTTRETVGQAIDTARGLPPVALCEDLQRLQADVAPPEDPVTEEAVEAMRGKLARLNALERGGRYAEALAAVLPMIGDAERLGYLPLLAEVELLAGKLSMHAMKTEGGAHLERALQAGLAARDDMLVAEALAIQVFQLGYVERRPMEALVLAPLGWGFLRRIDEPPRLLALMHNNVGIVHSELGQKEAAIVAFESGMAMLDRHAPEDPLRWALVNNLAGGFSETGQHTRVEPLVRAAVDQIEAQYGECFPIAASLRLLLGSSDEAMGHPERAVQAYEEGIACLIAEGPTYAVMTFGELGSLYLQRGDLAQARRQIARAEALLIRVPGSGAHALDIDVLRAKLAVVEGRLISARQDFLDLRGRAVETMGSTSVAVMEIDTQLAVIAYREHDYEAARRHLQQVEQASPQTLVLGERGLYAFTLAQVLRALNREPERVASLVDDAIAAYTAAGVPYARNVAEVRAWAAAR